MSGSGLFSKQGPNVPHLSTGELADLRKDIVEELAPLAAIAIDEFTNPAAGGAAALLDATATTLAAQTVLAAALKSGGKTLLAAQPRNLTFTTSGDTAADAPATATITGTDRDGRAQTEVVTIAQIATIAVGVKLFKTVTSIVYAVGQGTDAAVSIGIGNAMPLSKKPKARAGLTAPVREIAVGAVVTTGTLDATNLSYTPAAAPDGTKDFAVFYEYDAAV
jgi:hypothetical protein